MRPARSETISRVSSVCASFSGISMLVTGSALDRHAHQVAPLRPAPIIVADVFVAQQMGEHEPGRTAALADAAVDDDVVVGAELRLVLVDRPQLLGGLERAV